MFRFGLADLVATRVLLRYGYSGHSARATPLLGDR